MFEKISMLAVAIIITLAIGWAVSTVASSNNMQPPGPHPTTHDATGHTSLDTHNTPEGLDPAAVSHETIQPAVESSEIHEDSEPVEPESAH